MNVASYEGTRKICLGLVFFKIQGNLAGSKLKVFLETKENKR
jgi:hypothetical protein